VRVDEIMQTDLVSCGPTATVVEAAATMCARGVGACLVMEGPRLVGIFTERDLLRVFALGDDVRERTVGDLMTRNVTMAPPDADVICAATAQEMLAAASGRREETA